MANRLTWTYVYSAEHINFYKTANNMEWGKVAKTASVVCVPVWLLFFFCLDIGSQNLALGCPELVM